MSYLKEVPPDEATRETFETIRGAFGFVPNFFRAQAGRPDFVDTEVKLMGTILMKQGALTRQQKEYLFLVTSAANVSTYCVTAHCEIVRLLGIEGPEPEQVALDYTSTSLPGKTKALLAFASKLNSEPTAITAQDIENLRPFGFTDEHILEAVVIVGFAKFANFVAFGLGAVPDFNSSLMLGGPREATSALSAL